MLYIQHVSSQWSFNPTPRIYNQDPQRVIRTDDIKDPLRDGTYTAIQGSDGWQGSKDSVIWVINIGQILTTRDAQSKTIQLIQNIINYALWMLSFVSLIYLLYAGFQMVTAAGDESKFQAWQKALQYTAYAILGIWLSWIIIRFILIVIDQVVL